MSATISGPELSALMQSGGLFAVFDVRERGEYNQSQVPGATSLPRSQIEFRIAELVPDREIQIVLYDDGGQRAARAARTLTSFGYSRVLQLAGGLPAWQSRGFEVVSGVNVPSKAFGEKVHHEREVPDIAPEELKALQDRGAELVIFDVRTPEEYGRFCIPGGESVPGGDLILWADELRRKPTVIVNCAGRTRSIIAAAALRRLGLTNVRALRNGTMGWVLAGLQLESKPARRGPSAPPASREQALAAALKIAAEEGIGFIEPHELQGKIAGEAMKYIIDVRSEAEFAPSHVRGSINVPGGQAVQRADDFVAVRNAPIVFISNDSARAIMAAYWYRQMGFPQVAVLRDGLRGWQASGGAIAADGATPPPLGFAAADAAARKISVVDLRSQAGRSRILHVGSSLEFESGHVAGARWISRGWLDLKLPESISNRAQPIVLTCQDGVQSALAAPMLAEAGYQDVTVLDGGMGAWIAAGEKVDVGLSGCLVETNDVVLSPSIRGSKEDMENYLNWELKLKH